MNISSYLKRRIDDFVARRIRDICKESGVKLIYKTSFDVDTYIHHEKLIEIIRTNSSCDADPLILSLNNILPRLDVVIDVGANIGIVSCWLSIKSNQVYSFEPEEDNLNFLKSNLLLNKVDNVEVLPLAVGSKVGYVEFCVRNSFGHHGIQKRHISDIVDLRQVPITTLDKFCKEKLIDKVSLLKIDVEGNEIDVLLGFDEYLSSKKVDMIIFEHAPILHKKDEDKIMVFDLLNQYGYTVFDLQHRKITRCDMMLAKQGDFYAKFT
jgi:FkbM family methyltransferase